MDFQELKTEIQLIVRRPDLSTRIDSAITASVLKLHSTNFYIRDAQEGIITFPEPSTKFTFTGADVSTRFRKISGIISSTGLRLAHCSMGNLLDYYGYPKVNSFYESGDSINVNLQVADNKFGIVWFQFPVPTEVGFDSWIAREFPYIVINDAASRIFGQIGNDLQSKYCAQEVGQGLIILNSQNSSEPNYTGA